MIPQTYCIAADLLSGQGLRGSEEGGGMHFHQWAGRLFLACFLLFTAMTAASRLLPHPHAPLPAEISEEWRPELAGVRSMDEAMRVLPAYIARERGSREARVAAAIDHFIRDRFVHGESLLSYHHNWIAALAGSVWINLRMPVLPDDILHHRRAICSQQSIVFMELLQRYNIHYASVLMSWPSPDRKARGHFAVAARVDGRWLYFDPDQEAAQVGIPIERVLDGSALAALYGDKPDLLGAMRYAAAHGQIVLAHVDRNPAPRGGFFQQGTEWLSRFGWLLFGLLALAEMLLRRRRERALPPILVPAE
jgi:hypothetical protein